MPPQHQHEYPPESVDVEIDEYIYVYWHCNYAEVTSAQHSAKHDETFYGYGAECDTQKTVTYDYTIYESDDQPIETDSELTEVADSRCSSAINTPRDTSREVENEEVYYAFSNEVGQQLYERVAHLSPQHPTDSFEMLIELDGNDYYDSGEYSVVFSKEDTSVEEGWM